MVSDLRNEEPNTKTQTKSCFYTYMHAGISIGNG